MKTSDIRDEILAHVARTPGWLYPAEAAFLFDAATRVTGKGVIVEIGSWKGKSTIALAGGAERAPVYAVDTFQGSAEHRQHGPVHTFDDFLTNLRTARVDGRVRPICLPSLEAAIDFREPVELLFIDGDHSYDAVRADFEAWVPKVIPGGLVALHDTSYWRGPRRVVREAIYGRWAGIRVVRTITAFEKTPPKNLGDRFRWMAAFAKTTVLGLGISLARVRAGHGFQLSIGR